MKEIYWRQTAPAVDTELAARLKALEELALMDTAAEPEFDDLVEVATAICEVPTGVISLLDQRRQWFKARVGTTLQETSLEHSFCHHTIHGSDLMIVENALDDARFADNPFVQEEGGVRFYAGLPISAPSGVAIGTLCVWGPEPHQLTDTQKAALRVLARQINARIEQRTQRRALQASWAEAEDMRRRLSLSQQMFRSFMDSGPFHSFMKTSDGRFLYHNAPLAKHFNLAEDGILGKRDEELWPADMVAQYREHDLQVLRSGQLSVQEEDVVDASGMGRGRWRTYKFLVVTADGETVIGGVSLDVTAERERTLALQRSEEELQRTNAQLAELLRTDALTGLPNRRSFEEALAKEWAAAQRTGKPLSVVVLDLDDFKRRNDTYGHEAGDRVLQQLARVVKNCLRENDLFARHGGEEFTLLLPDTNAEQAAPVIDRLLGTIRSARWEHEGMTASAGLGTSLRCAGDVSALLRLADEALYEAKMHGKDRAVCRILPFQRAA